MYHNWLSLRFYRSPDSPGGGFVDLMDDDGAGGTATPDQIGDDNEPNDDDDEQDDEDEDDSKSARPGPPLGAAANEVGEKPTEHQELEEGNELTDFATKFLGLEKGMVLFDGEDEPVAFATLDPIDQMAVVQTRMEEIQASLPSQQEAQVLQSIRQAGGVDQYLRQQASAVTARPAETLSADEVNLRDIKAMYPNWSDAEQQEELAHRKTHTRFEDKTNILRNQQVQQEVSEQQRAEQLQDEQIARNIVTTAQRLTHIDGFKLDDDVRNEMLGDILEADESEPDVSRFLKSLDDPQELLRTQFWRKYGPALYEQAISQGKQGSRSTNRKPTAAGAVEPAQHVAGTRKTGRSSDIVDVL